jgi:HD superfamily phosphodiesterase
MRNLSSSNIVDISANYVIRKLAKELSNKYIYHNIHHTLDVVTKTLEIAFNSDLDEPDLIDIELAAWFHDLGFIIKSKGHETVSAELARSYLIEKGHPRDRIRNICSAILSTDLSVIPQNLFEEVLADADLSHIGSENYIIKQELLRIEIEYAQGRVFNDLQWTENNLNFIKNNPFRTSYAKEVFKQQRQQNIDYLESKVGLLSRD